MPLAIVIISLLLAVIVVTCLAAIDRVNQAQPA